MEDEWSCVACTLKNDASSKVCEVCGTSRACDKHSWLCLHCTLLNASTASRCEVCECPREAATAIKEELPKALILLPKDEEIKPKGKRQKVSKWPPGNANRPEAWREMPVCELGNTDQCQQLLEEYGVVVFRNVLNASDVTEARDLFWEWLEHNTPARRSRPLSFNNAVARSCGYVNTGVTTNFSIGQSKFLWHCRLKAVPAWRTVWNSQDLISSFDGCGIWPNPYLPGSQNAFTDSGWFHLDQNFHEHPHFLGYQGLVQISDLATEETGSLVVVPKSHRDFRANCERSNKSLNRGSFVRLNTSADRAYCNQRAVQCAPLHAGDIVIWDSRIVHCSAAVCRNLPSTSSLHPKKTSSPTSFPIFKTPSSFHHEENHDKDQPALARLVAYVAMMPRSRLNARAAANRRNAVLQGYGTGWNGLLVRRRPQPAANYRAPSRDHPLWSLV